MVQEQTASMMHVTESSQHLATVAARLRALAPLGMAVVMGGDYGAGFGRDRW